MIHLVDVSKQYGPQIVLRKASFQILPGTRTGLVGPNGAGKTTLLRIIAGEEQPDAGEVSRPKRCVVGYFSQDVGDMRGRSALAEVMAASADVTRLGGEIREMEDRMSRPLSEGEMAALLERYGEAVEEFEHRDGYNLESRAAAVLSGLGVATAEQGMPVETFSGGWKMRIALARVLTLCPDVLLLDEPTNHLDLESIMWLEEWIVSEFKGAVLMTTHDREFMNRVCGRIVEVDAGAVSTYGGDYDFYERERDTRREQLLATHRRQQEMLAKEQEFIARFQARASHAAQVQSRVKKLEKIERVELPARQKVIRFDFAKPPRSGDEVVKMEGLSKRWPASNGGERVALDGVFGLIRRQERIAVVGVNGAGKSTLLKLLAGQVEPSAGTLTFGANVAAGYFSQLAMDVLDPAKTVFETVQDAIPTAARGVIHNLCAAFLFQGEAVEKRIEVLSGGERSRVVLATLLARPLNLLILDEPTNHLDILSREILLDALGRFAGTVVLVSHDRHFLRVLANRVFEIDGGRMRAFEGGYDYYREKVAKQSGT